MSKGIAEHCLSEVRRLMKGTLKSGNKYYEPGLSRVMSSKQQDRKWDTRNENAPKALDALVANRQRFRGTGLTHLELGGRLHQILKLENPVEKAKFAGNCGEQGLVALYIAALRAVPLGQLWLWNWSAQFKGYLQDYGFAHSALFIGTFDSESDRGDRAPVSQVRGWYCDPWLNIACEYSQYPMISDANLKKWEDKHKVLWGGQNNIYGKPIKEKPSSYLNFAATDNYFIYNATDRVPG